MPISNHAQRSFAAGELAPGVHGQFGTDVYEKGLESCIGVLPLPAGSLRMRAGSWQVDETPTKPRLIPFNVSAGDPYTLVLEDAKLSVYGHSGVKQSFVTNIITNGQFDADLGTWINLAGPIEAASGGYAHFPSIGSTLRQNHDLVIGRSYTIRFRLRGTGGTCHLSYGAYGPANGLQEEILGTGQWVVHSFTFVVAGAGVFIQFTSAAGAFDIDDVELLDDTEVPTDSLVAPWAAAQLADIQYDQDLTKNRMLLVHGNVQPQLLAVNVHGTWEFRAAPFVDPPTAWGTTNWPACIDWGFQGRLWLGGEPDEPNVFRGSYSGQPFKFTSGGSTAADAVSFSASVRGALRWLQGQKVLLLGAERVEQTASGGSTVIAPGNIDVRDESAFGSAAIQSVHIGDQALWVTRDGRHVRAMNFDLQTDGWVSRALTFLASHLTVGGIREVHFARSPHPTIIALLTTGRVIGCTYDRAEQVLAWWRLPLAGDANVNSGCVVDTPDGSELWLSATRAGGEYLERIPFHEVGVVYVDSAKSGVVAVDGTFGGLAHLDGETVRVIVAGVLRANQVVVGGAVVVAVEDAGLTIVVGLPFTARAKTLKPEGGNPRGTAQGTKRRRPKVYLRLSDSALPTVNGERPDGAVPLAAMDTAAGRVSGDFEYPGIDWEEDGQVTIEQDLPFRTEILAVFGPVQTNDL